MPRAARFVAAFVLAWSTHASVATEVHYRPPWSDGLSLFILQAPGGRMGSHFLKSNLYAVDVEMLVGTAVLAARDGIVADTEARHGAWKDEEPASYDGNFIRVRHEDGSIATYAHLKHQGVVVKQGDAVKASQLLGYSGATGDVDRPHLHFGVSRWQRNRSGWMEEVSLPIIFAIGVPPYAFAPRTAMIVTPNSTGPAERPRFAGEARAPVLPAQRSLTAEEELIAWLQLAAFLACAVVGMYLTWKFSRG